MSKQSRRSPYFSAHELTSTVGHGRPRFSPSVLALALSAALALPGTAQALDWSGAVDNDWFTINNWTNPAGAIPTAADNVIVQSAVIALVSQPGATTQSLIVGNNGAGTLVVDNGATLTSSSAILANQPIGTGGVLVNGAGSAWNITNSLAVGGSGVGNLVIQNGGAVTNGFGQVGAIVGSTGTVTVDGAGGASTWTNAALLVGNFGTGKLDILNGGTVQSAGASIGEDTSGVGTVTVDASTWTNGDLSVGFSGKGTLTILNGGQVTSANVIVGNALGGTGTATVAGSSKWNVDSLSVGEHGSGTVSITGGGTVTTLSGGGTIGTFGTGVGAVTVDGGVWLNNNTVSIGELGTGTLTIKGGGSVTDTVGVIGTQGGSTGTVTVDGANSLWTNTSDLSVGRSGTGTLAITNGGAVSNAFGSIGTLGGSIGTVTVDGANSLWTNTSNLSVGKFGTGTLAITNGGAVSNVFGFIGEQNGSSGAVTVDGGSWTNSQGLIVGNLGAGTLTIANGGAVTATGGLLIANAPGSSGTLIIGERFFLPAVAPGNLTAPGGVQFGAGNGTLLFNHTDTSGNYVFGADISGPSGQGAIVQQAGFTNLTGNSSNFTGVTSVVGGRLAVNGSLGSAVNVTGGAILGGSGTVGGIQANAGAIIAPGNSIGTLNVNGNVTFAANSIYRVEVDAAGHNDKLAVTGTATLNGGTVEVLATVPGSYAPSTAYTILTAGGGITGSFAGVTSDQAFLDPSLSYDLTNAYLTLTRNDTPFGGVGQTPGQTSTGTGAETLGVGNPIYNALVVLSAPQARAAFDQLSGEVHASARSVLLEDSRFVREAALDRLRAFDTGMAAPTAIGAETPGKPADWLSIRDTTFWGRATGSWGTLDGDGNAAGVKRETAGLLIGADRLVGEAGRVGVVGGYSRSTFDINARNSSGTADNYHVGVYGGNRWGDLALRTGLGYTRHDISTGRTVNFPGFSDSLKADYKAATTQLFGELGYRINSGMLSEQVALEPFVNLAHVNVSTKGFTEQGGAAALTSAGGSSGITFSTLGLRASTTVGMAGGADVTARGMLGYRHAFGDTTPNTSLAFAGGAPFAIAGAPIAKGAAVVEAGLDFKLTPAATLGVSYGGQFGSGLTDQTAKVNLNVMF